MFMHRRCGWRTPASAAGRVMPWPGSTPRSDATPGAVLSPAAAGKSWSGSHTIHRGSEPGPSCRPGAHRIRGRDAGQIQMRRGLRLRQRDSARARRRVRLARLPGTCPAAPAAVDEQAADGIWHAVQGRTYGRQAPERLPLFLILKADLEHHAPAVRMPRPVDSAVGQRRLDQCRVVLLPATGKPRTRRAVPRSTTIQPLRTWYVFLWLRNGRSPAR